jgi:NitT/TauT family transport system substrate-binding protein
MKGGYALVSRREALKLAGAGAALAGGTLLAACGGSAAPAPSASAPASSAAAKASAAAAPSQSAAKPAASAAASASGAAGAAIKVGYSQIAVAFAPLFAAKDNGLFTKNGLDVTLQQVNGPAAVPALLANEVQLDGLGANEVTRAVLAGAPLTSIATLGDLPVFLLYADKKYKTVQDLAGQTIGVTSLGSSTDVTAHLFLEHFGMLDKVKIVPAGGTSATVLAALEKGVVQAAIISPDNGVAAAKAGFVPIVDGVKLGVPLNFSVIGVKKSYLQEQPATVKSFLKAYQQAWTYLGDPANKAAVVSLLEKNLKTTSDAAEVGYTSWFPVWSGKKTPTIEPEGVTNTLKFSDDPNARNASAAQFIDNSVLQSIQ